MKSPNFKLSQQELDFMIWCAKRYLVAPALVFLLAVQTGHGFKYAAGAAFSSLLGTLILFLERWGSDTTGKGDGKS